MVKSLVNEILTYNELHDLWGAGYTIVRRNKDPYEIDPKLVPYGIAYQWNAIDPQRDPGQVRPDGWNPVPYSRHEGVFAPWGTVGVIQRSGLELCERPKGEVETELQRSRTKAQQNVDDWAVKNAALGITGSVRIATQTELGKLDTDAFRKVGDAIYANPETRTVETTTAIPRGMTPYIAAIFKERDRLEAEVVRKDRTLVPGPIADKFYATIEVQDGAQWWPTLRAILLPIAIDNVREALKKETTDE